MTADWYHEHRKNIFVSDNTVPVFIGFTAPLANLGVAHSWGWEVSLGWNDKIGDNFRYWAKLNLSYNQNEVLEMEGDTYEQRLSVSEVDTASAHARCISSGSTTTRVLRPTTRRSSVQLSQSRSSRTSSRVMLCMSTSTRTALSTVTICRATMATPTTRSISPVCSSDSSGSGLSMSAQFTGAWNVSRLISDVFRQPFYRSSSNNDGGLLQYHVDNTWTPDNPSQSAEYPRATWENATQNYATSTLYEKDAKYLRLKTLQVAYDFRFPWMHTLGLNQLQLALSGYNLFTVTPYKWGDPETRASSSPSYPLQRTYTISLKLGF